MRKPVTGEKDAIPRTRYGWAVVAAVAALVVAQATRLVLLALGASAVLREPWAVARALSAGAVFDMVVALWIAVPWVFLVTVTGGRRYPSRVQRVMRRAFAAATVAGLLFVAVAEVMFFDEFNGRFNFVAVDYLIYPTEVVTNIWQSYPTAWILGAISVATAGILWLLEPLLGAIDQAPPVRLRRRVSIAGLYAAVLAVVSAFVPPSLSRVSDNRVVNELAANGYYTFWSALRGQDAPYDGWYATRPDSAVYGRLQRLLREPASDPVAAGSTVRQVHAVRPERRMNVVVVLEESFGSEFVGVLHPRDSGSITPEFDSLTRLGTFLTRNYSTGNRTIRALEATTSSLPPLPGVSIVRRPASTDLFTLPNLLRSRGYATEFIYGGRALFDGMGDYVHHNGIEHVVEQKDFPDDAFATAWGVADEVIFDRALAEMDSLSATGRPFYTLVLTVSNHKPYTYPTGRIAQDPAARRRVHAVRYADWALGRFMRQAQTRPYYENTLFVLMGDHGARVYGAAEIPLGSYEVPVLFIAPGVVPAGARVGTLSSSLDVPPTILSLLGIEYESKFFGRDILAADSASGRALMTHNSDIALMRDGRIAVLGLHEQSEVYVVDAGGTMRRIEPADPRSRALTDEAIAYFQGADHLYRSGRYSFEGSEAAGAGVNLLAAGP